MRVWRKRVRLSACVYTAARVHACVRGCVGVSVRRKFTGVAYVHSCFYACP